VSTSDNDHQAPIEDTESQRLLKRSALARDAAPRANDEAVAQAGPAQAQPVSEAYQQGRYLTPDEIVASLNGKSRKRAQPGLLDRWKQKGGILGTIATVLIFLLKVGGPFFFVLVKLKVFLLFAGSMALSIWLESKVFGWQLAVGIVLLIFIHECGHALAARLRGIPTGVMVFIPFMGAFVTTKKYGRDLVEDAFIGIMGPVVGSVAAALCAAYYFVGHERFWLVLGAWGIAINLFNLLPTPPLDGGWIAPLFSPKLLAIGAVIGVFAGFYNPFIWLLLIMSLPRIISGWKADPRTQPYYQVPAAARWNFGMLYGGLAACLAFGLKICLSHIGTSLFSALHSH
jgi:Zn-dependent protease